MTAEARSNIFKEGWKRFKQSGNLIPVTWRVFDFFEYAGIVTTDSSRLSGIDLEKRAARFKHESVFVASLTAEIAAKTAIFFTVGVPAMAVDIASSPLRYGWSVGEVIRERRKDR